MEIVGRCYYYKLMRVTRAKAPYLMEVLWPTTLLGEALRDVDEWPINALNR